MIQYDGIQMEIFYLYIFEMFEKNLLYKNIYDDYQLIEMIENLSEHIHHQMLRYAKYKSN